MGARLEKYYEFIREKGGVKEQMRLAMKTCIPSKHAGKEPDSEENIQKFRQAIKEITGMDVPF